MNKINLKEIPASRLAELLVKLKELYVKHEVIAGFMGDEKLMSLMNDTLLICENTNELALCWLTIGNKTATRDWKRDIVDLKSISDERNEELATQCFEIIKRYMKDEECCTEGKYANELMNLAENKSELALVTIAGSRFFITE